MPVVNHVYTGYTCIRCCGMCFEIVDKKGNQFMAISNRRGYSRDYIVECRDDPDLAREKSDSLARIAYTISSRTGSASYGAFELHPWNSRYSSPDPAFIEAALKDIKIANNSRYIGYYCVALLCEIARLKQENRLPYLRELLPYLDKTRDIADKNLDLYLDAIEEGGDLPEDIRRPLYFALAKAKLNFQILPHIRESIETEAKKAICGKDENLEKLMKHLPTVEATSQESNYIYGKYNGASVRSAFRVLYWIKHGEAEHLYNGLMQNPTYFEDAFGTWEGISPMEVFRYLVSHGYEGQKKEIAKALLGIVKEQKDYFAIRAFLSDEEVIEVYKKKPKGMEHWGDQSRILPIHLDKKKVADVLKVENTYYYNLENYYLSSYVYGYGEGELYQPADYSLRGVRSDVRDCLTNKNDGRKYIDIALGLIAYGDKTTPRYFQSEFASDFPADPYFALTKAYIGSLGKKIKDMYVYSEGE